MDKKRRIKALLNKVLMKHLPNKWISYKDNLPLNSALPFHLEYKNGEMPKPYTTAWAQKNGVQTILFMPDRRHGNRAPFLRNENMVKLSPVEAVVGEGSGIQSNLAQRLRQAGVPVHVRRIAD